MLKFVFIRYSNLNEKAIVIPKRAFESQDQMDEFERIVKRNIQKHMAV